MTQALVNTVFSTLELFGIGWYDYYGEWSEKLLISFSCRENKYTGTRYFRTMRPISIHRRGVFDNNEWIEYEGKIDDIING